MRGVAVGAGGGGLAGEDAGRRIVAVLVFSVLDAEREPRRPATQLVANGARIACVRIVEDGQEVYPRIEVFSGYRHDVVDHADRDRAFIHVRDHDRYVGAGGIAGTVRIRNGHHDLSGVLMVEAGAFGEMQPQAVLGIEDHGKAVVAHRSGRYTGIAGEHVGIGGVRIHHLNQGQGRRVGPHGVFVDGQA
ncbi:MAG: hypothetical protein F4169_11355 [Gammaproteobacteria bacterium]|nr:hypothetical protein [Gammaproteobacteria bacterium]